MTPDILDQTDELAEMLRDNTNESTVDHALRVSHLKWMSRSARHARHAILVDSEPSLAMRIGKGAHSLLLGGPPVVLYGGAVRRGKDYDAFVASQPTDAIIMRQADYDRSHRIADAVRASSLACDVLFRPLARFEETIWWEQLGRKRRSTPDVRTVTMLAELKSTRDASVEKFQWDARRMSYHAQLADYGNAMFYETGKFPEEVYIVAVENVAPFDVTVHRLSARALDMGERQVRLWLEQWLACEQTGKFPGASQSVVEFDIAEPSELVYGEDD